MVPSIRFHTLVSNAYDNDMDRAKNLFGPPSLIPHNVAYAPCFVIPLLPPWRKLSSELAFIHCVNKISFRLFRRGPISALWHRNPHLLQAKRLMFAKASISGFVQCRDSMPHSKDHINDKCMVQR